MTGKMRQGCVGLLLSIIVLLPCSTWLMYQTDPLGGYRYYNDLSKLFAGYVVSERGYSMYPGLYQFSNWTALIERNGNRHVPNAKDTDCEIVFLGDSVAFGYGVSDNETFVNLIARQVNAHVTNTAIPAYNSENIRLTLADYPAADGYIYVIVSNDDEPTKTRANVFPILSHGVGDIYGVYLDALTHLNRDTPRERVRFEADLAALHERSDVLMVGFRDSGGWYKTLPEYVKLIPHWTHSNSFIDGHANAAGNQEIASALLSYVQVFESTVCE